MRLIFNFIFFGIVYFLLWHFFPTQFANAVAWMSQALVFVTDFIMNLAGQIKTQTGAPAATPEHKALIIPFMLSFLQK